MTAVLVDRRTPILARRISNTNISKTTPALMITEEDIRQLLSDWNSVPSWIKAHVWTRQPAHRYDGELVIEGHTLVYGGRDIKEREDFKLEIPFASITEVSLRFSDQLEASIDLTFGIGGPVPLAVEYRDNDRSETLYFNTSFGSCFSHMSNMEVSNRRWYDTLYETVTRYRG